MRATPKAPQRNADLRIVSLAKKKKHSVHSTDPKLYVRLFVLLVGGIRYTSYTQASDAARALGRDLRAMASLANDAEHPKVSPWETCAKAETLDLP